MAARPSDNSADRSAVSPRTPDDDTRLGEQLRRARERRGLTLAQIAKETKIPLRHLEALEHGNLETVPGGFYRRAEIRAFALAVNLDQTLALGWLERALESTIARETPPEPARALEATRSRSGRLIAIGLGVGIAVFLLATAGRKSALHSDPQVRRVTELLPHSLPAARKTVPAAVIRTSQRARLDQVAAAPVASDGRVAMATPLAGARAPTASNRDIAVTAEQTIAPAAANSFTELVVETQPAGARVTVNGIGWGAAPVTIRYLPEGDKAIRVSKDGYTSEARTVRLEEGHLRRLEIRLRSVP